MGGIAERGTNETVSVVVRVRYPEVDRMGVAYHANYFVWFEDARTELMRRSGCVYRELEDREGLMFPVIRAEARYRAPARYDDRLTVIARLSRIGGVRMRFDYEVYGEDPEELLVTGFTEHAAVGRNGRPRRIPEGLKRLLRAGEGNDR